MYLCDTICNVLHFSIFGHTSYDKHDVPHYGVEETNYVDINEVTENGDFLVLIKDGFSNT